MTTAGLSPTLQVPAATIASIEVTDQPVSDLWRELLSHTDVADTFVHAVRDFARGKTVPELYDALEEQSIPHWLRSRIRDVALGNRREAWHLVADIIPELGHGRSSVDDILSTATLFRELNGDDVPTVAFVVGKEFKDESRRKRSKICRLIATLANAFDVRFVATGVTQIFVRAHHRDELPGVNDWRRTDSTDTPLAKVVDDAIETLDPDTREIKLLRELEDQDSETLSYNQLYGIFSEVNKPRVRQTIAALDELALISKFGPQSNRKVELLEAGRGVLDRLDAEIGRQQELDESVRKSGKSSPQCRVTPRTGGEGEAGPKPYQVDWMSRYNHVAGVACGHPGSVTIANGPVPAGDGRTHEVSYDPNEDQAVVAVQADEPLPYAVSTAVALATPWFVDDVLPPSRIQSIDEPPAILRDARCIGELSDEALADPLVLRDKLVDWGQRIQDWTVDLRHGEYEDRDSFRSMIMRSAHGLTGSIVHLLDAAGIDLIREVRVPSGADRDDLEDLSETVAISAAIQSTYDGVHNGFRQLYEDRGKKRAFSFTPTVDATEPFGSLIGSFVFRGSDIGRLKGELEKRLESPRDLHDDAPEFAIPIPIRETGRPEIAAVANKILLPKRIQPTEGAVTLCHALVPDPFAVSRGLEQLEGEDEPRQIRIDELRYALSTLDTESILPDLSPTASAMVEALLTAETRLSQTELADRADVSARSVRNNVAELEAVGLLDSTDGYRLTMSFRTRKERRSSVVPNLVDGTATLIDTVDSLLERSLPPDRYGDPDDPLGKALWWPPDPWILEGNDDLGGWFSVSVRLAAEQPVEKSVVTMGPTIEQQPLPTTGNSNEVNA
ncbi:winged helix-turn-helix domain-containing protein [Natrinema halophilum]|uniref:winged helix-turn-helix domain-containing protein n=1 Tax=Natrinema halophilum TaxID=1699371 RepID=UPI001F1F45BA|nr:helix-turn-helix domain-containing protein [Natrinema halophilum]UHQ96412.1 helix-turn-helix domain-containing protein [Natrinema halophilum]